MKELVKVIKVSSRELFEELRNKGSLFCYSINEELEVTNFFYNHIIGNKIKRKNKEAIKRLSAINLTEKILKVGKLVETRDNPYIEGKKYKKSFRILLEISGIDFYLVIAKKANGKNILISTFLNIK